MKSIYTTTVIVLFLALQNVLVSCENLIDVEIPGNQVGSQQVFEDAQTANAALAGLYASLFNNSVLSGEGMGVLLGSYTDDLDGYYVGSTNGAMDIYRNRQLATNEDIARIWGNSYQQIYMTNAIISGAENSVSIGSADKDRIKGGKIHSFLLPATTFRRYSLSDQYRLSGESVASENRIAGSS